MAGSLPTLESAAPTPDFILPQGFTDSIIQVGWSGPVSLVSPTYPIRNAYSRPKFSRVLFLSNSTSGKCTRRSTAVMKVVVAT